MSESVGWIGVVLALIALGERVYDKYNTRRSAKEKAEADRIAARDKMEFDAEFREAKARVADLEAGHAKCQEDSKKLEQKVAELERRLETRAAALAAQDRLDKRELETKIAAVHDQAK